MLLIVNNTFILPAIKDRHVFLSKFLSWKHSVQKYSESIFLNDIMKTNREYERKKTMTSGNKYRAKYIKGNAGQVMEKGRKRERKLQIF